MAYYTAHFHLKIILKNNIFYKIRENKSRMCTLIFTKKVVCALDF